MDDHINEVFLFNKLSTDKFLWLQVLVGTHRLPKPSISRCTTCMVINLSKLAQYQYQGHTIYRCSNYGPTFGGYQGRHDIQLRNNAGNIQNSFTTCGSTYAVSTVTLRSPSACSFQGVNYLPRLIWRYSTR